MLLEEGGKYEQAVAALRDHKEWATSAENKEQTTERKNKRTAERKNKKTESKNKRTNWE